ncbi:MAG: agmatine deiminase family protein [Deltaproteobacteria bacterium]|nr:agmatine deiminase family protein [Deltaproteobacteria bacterium]
MPAEWAPHRRTWLAWPHNAADWPGKFAPLPWVYGEMVRHLARGERVGILVGDAALKQAATRVLDRVGADLSQVDFLEVRTDRSWVRDTGPSFVRRASGEVAAVCWAFNAWAKYNNCKLDAQVGAAIAGAAGAAVFEPRRPDGARFVLEGGAIDVDGEGTLLCTEECLLDRVQGRNPGVAREAQEAVLREALGVERVLWLEKGIVGDDTHGHIDDLARFVAPGRVLLCREDAPADPNHAVCVENRARLCEARDARGRRLEVIDLPMPRPLVFRGQRLPASYANFYVGNRVVLVPTFNDPNDRLALNLLAELFPSREVVGIHCVDLVWGLGTIHCATQQEPG